MPHNRLSMIVALNSISSCFRDGPKRIGVTTLTFRESRDVMGHVTIRFPIGHFLFSSSESFSVKFLYPQYKGLSYRQTDDRQTDTALQHERDHSIVGTLQEIALQITERFIVCSIIAELSSSVTSIFFVSLLIIIFILLLLVVLFPLIIVRSCVT